MKYTIWFCRVIYKDKKEDSKIGGLEYIKELYINIPKEDLKKYAKSICQDFGYIYEGISDERYCLFKDNEEYCLFFEEELDKELL